jgi:hypothetical protein
MDHVDLHKKYPASLGPVAWKRKPCGSVSHAIIAIGINWSEKPGGEK